MTPTFGSDVHIHAEVKDALQRNKAVVALESNVISHGLPYPLNLETVERMEAEVRAAGAVPAVTALLEGQILIGLTDEQKAFFAQRTDLPKASSRDVPMLLATRQPAVTTVAASLLAAELAGITFFASAGIGGVHRGAQDSFDISSDLIQLTRSPVVAVTAGCKNILDIGLTLEYLETHCVPCVTYQFDHFPAFTVRSSGFKSPFRVDDLSTLSRAILRHQHLGRGGFLVAAPIEPQDAIDGAAIEHTIDTVTRQAAEQGITGKGLTKFVMRAINAVMDGKTDRANAAVLISNARFAAELAVCHAQMRASDGLEVEWRAQR